MRPACQQEQGRWSVQASALLDSLHPCFLCVTPRTLADVLSIEKRRASNRPPLSSLVEDVAGSVELRNGLDLSHKAFFFAQGTHAIVP